MPVLYLVIGYKDLCKGKKIGLRSLFMYGTKGMGNKKATHYCMALIIYNRCTKEDTFTSAQTLNLTL
jgi:hypothetical protein